MRRSDKEIACFGRHFRVRIHRRKQRAGATCHVPFCTMSEVNNNNVNECHVGTVQWCRKGISGKGEYGVINENKSAQI